MMNHTPRTLTHPERKALARVVVFLAVLGACGFFLGSANPLRQVPPLILLAPASLALFAALMPTYWGAFYAGWFTSALGYAACLYWVTIPMRDFGGVSWFIAIPAVLGLGVYLGLFGGFFSVSLRLLRRQLSPFAACFLAAPLWAGLEIARGWLLTGFPWAPLASAFTPWPIWIQGAAVLGAYGLSGVYAGIATFLVEAAPLRISYGYARPVSRKKRLLAALFAVIPLLVLYMYGMRALQTPVHSTMTVSVGLVQGNVNQDQKWEPRYQQQTVERYLALSERAVDPALGLVEHPVDILIWPETAMPFYSEDNPQLTQLITSFSERFTVPIAFGAPGKSQNSGQKRYHNRMWLFSPVSTRVQSYDKGHLLPFGEYVPFSIPLPFIEYFSQGLDFSPGQGTVLRHGPMVLGPLICFEAIFPELAQQRVKDGATLLVNISNDAWFGLSSAPVQHLHNTMLRAVEQGRYIIRSTNTGISAVIDPKGRITSSGGLFRAETVIGEARLIATTTVYHALEPYLFWFFIVVPALPLAWCFTRARKNARGHE